MRARIHAAVASRTGRRPVLASAAFAAMVVATTAAASGPTVLIEPGGALPVGTHTLAVTGSGFDPVGNHGNGIYVAFGPVTPAPAYYLDPTIYSIVKWVHPGGQESGVEAAMGSDGAFATTLDVASSFDGPQGPIDCTAVECAVVTFGAHGSQDRSQDTCTAVTFVPVTASGVPGPIASAPASITVPPSADASPTAAGSPTGAAASPVAGSPCDVIGAASGS